ncbi:vesicle transport protein sft2a [Plasmopara halstedii]|uniref:Vesicle transport protein n=1 Tax=Plasmopara halstedii TaxID=4781 RepID=A0A0P1A5L8_PLAHL|nr:vesicle transport protein sft2a [Plasmopara halstedii]CEG35829.1 vesicle transport protein sft2a [Plasmopara halstedii]|eukprot:XP_024572198.1 vesicle transport protein sft2a [Plasmopara halstedii]
MDQIKLVISSAGDKVAGAANDASKTIANMTGEKNSTNKTSASNASSLDMFNSTCPNLTKKQRMIGFISCFVLGFLVSFGSTFALIVGSDNGTKFGITYSLGNIISLCGSGFLVGPKQQVKLMFKPLRRIATIIYLAMIVVVLVVALTAPQLGLVVLLLVIVQCVAAVWYSASYIPFGRKVLKSIAQKVCGAQV